MEKHGKLAAVVFPLSVLGGFAYTMRTGEHPLAASHGKADGEAAHNVLSLSADTLGFPQGRLAPAGMH